MEPHFDLDLTYFNVPLNRTKRKKEPELLVKCANMKLSKEGSRTA